MLRAGFTVRPERIGITDPLPFEPILLDAETSKLVVGNAPKPGMPEPGTIVALSGGGGKAKMRNAQVEIVSYVPLERLPTVEAATWLDQTIVAGTKPAIREHGFGAETSKTLVAREDWLIAKGYAVSRQPGMITPKPGMLKELNDRGIGRVAQRLSAETGLSHVPIGEAHSFSGQHVRTIDLPTRRLAVIQGRQDFTLVPWRPELAKMRGKDIPARKTCAAMNKAVSAIGLA